MHPTIILFAIPWTDWAVQVDAYPLAHLVAFFVTLVATMRIYGRDVGPPAKVLDVFLIGVPAALIGAHYAAGWTSGHPVRHPLETLAVHRFLGDWTGANKSAYGGLLVGVAAAALVARWHRLPLGKLFDAAAPGLALGVVITRLGCFLGGCCYGRPTDSFLGVHFPDGHGGMARLAAGDPRGLHPTQLYLAAAALAIAAVLLVLRRHRERRPGDLFLLGTALYAATTFGIEFLRDDPGRWFRAELSHSQWISLAILVGLAVGAVGRAAAPRRALAGAAATGLLVVTLAAATARGAEPEPIAPDVVVDIVSRGLVDGNAEAPAVLASLLEIGGGGPVGTWSRIGVGASRLLDGHLADALAEWREAAADAGDTPWGAHAALAVGLGEVMSGRAEAAIPAFRAAVETGDGQLVPVAALSLGRLLAERGDAAGAEASFRRVLGEYPRSTVADDAALGLGRLLVRTGRLAEAQALLADAARRYERDWSYRTAGRDHELRWERLGLLGERRLGELLRQRATRAVDHGWPVLDQLLGALTDRHAGRDLRRLRRRVARLVKHGGAGAQADAARTLGVAGSTAGAGAASPAADPPARRTLVESAARFYAGRAAILVLALALAVVATMAVRARRRPAPRRFGVVRSA
jgi:phosphatidylglycerol:prolipoprotein diacylglycerol transferase